MQDSSPPLSALTDAILSSHGVPATPAGTFAAIRERRVEASDTPIAAITCSSDKPNEAGAQDSDDASTPLQAQGATATLLVEDAVIRGKHSRLLIEPPLAISPMHSSAPEKVDGLAVVDPDNITMLSETRNPTSPAQVATTALVICTGDPFGSDVGDREPRWAR